MIARVLPALIALPVMGIAIAGDVVLTGEIGWIDVLDGVVSGGAIMLHKAMIVTFGGALVMQRSAWRAGQAGSRAGRRRPARRGHRLLLLVALLFSTSRAWAP